MKIASALKLAVLASTSALVSLVSAQDPMIDMMGGEGGENYEEEETMMMGGTGGDGGGGNMMLGMEEGAEGASPVEYDQDIGDMDFDFEEMEDEGEDDVMLGILMTQGMEMAANCDIDLISLFSLADSMPNDAVSGGDNLEWMQGLKSFASLFASQCSPSDEDKFRSALMQFQTCSSFDLEKVMETLIDAEIGALLECALSIAPVVEKLGQPGFELVIPDQCIEGFLGKNPLGDMMRTMNLYPDEVLPCFAALSAAAPACTIQEWPIPLIGPILKKVTCLVGAAMPVLEALATAQLEAFSSCLPDALASVTQQQCTDAKIMCAEAGATSMDLPEPFLGAPLSDMTKRVAKMQDGLMDVPARYQSFVDSCVTHVWPGWSYENGDYDEQKYSSSSGSSSSTPAVPAPAPAPAESTTTTSSSSTSAVEGHSMPCDASSTPMLGAYQQQQQAPAEELLVEKASGGAPSPGGHFGGGLLTGVILTGALWAFMAYRQKKAGSDRRSYDTVEMVGAGGYSIA